MIINFQRFLESKSKFPNIKEVKIDNFKVLIGRDSESNDYLTTKIASEEDIWMHAKGVPGSHVVIKVKENIPTLEVIKEVAKLAIKNSKSKSGGIVVYCKAKFVKKLKDMKPGQVSVDYKNSNEIEIKI
jgi:predicted ribosome quality control (RQC) complex YloA/Tae2 family protein